MGDEIKWHVQAHVEFKAWITGLPPIAIQTIPGGPTQQLVADAFGAGVRVGIGKWQPLETAPEGDLIMLLVGTGMVTYPTAILSGYFDDEYRPPIDGKRRWLDPQGTSLSDSGMVPTAWKPMSGMNYGS